MKASAGDSPQETDKKAEVGSTERIDTAALKYDRPKKSPVSQRLPTMMLTLYAEPHVDGDYLLTARRSKTFIYPTAFVFQSANRLSWPLFSEAFERNKLCI